MNTKWCPGCECYKSANAFNKKGTGLQTYCKPCKRTRYGTNNYKGRESYFKDYYRSNRDRLLEQSKQGYRTDKYKKFQYAHAYRARKTNQFVEYVNPQTLYERDRGICGICSKHVDLKDFSIDHIKPLSKGGEHSYINTQTSHLSCNMQKGTQYEEVS